MSHDILLRALQLGESDEAFAIVGVTNTEGPTAVKAGNKSIIRQDGSIEGWVGGHCTEEEILRNALKAMEDGTTRTLKLSTCHGGTMDVYVEPYLPRRKLVVLGRVPIVSALSRLAKILNFNVVVIDKSASKEKYPQADLVLKTLEELDSVRLTRQTYVVIATMGEHDQEYAARLVDSEAPYLGIVAGKKRASEILDFLNAAGVREDQVSKVKSPAGIYLRAVTAEEIALSIMAEIIDFSRSQSGDLRGKAPESQKRGPHPKTRIAASPLNVPRHGGEQVVAVDPVCGMTVGAAQPRHFSTVEGRKIAFCSAVCKEEFDQNPSKYLLKQRS